MMVLAGSSVAPATWNGHGKAWSEWVSLAGNFRSDWDHVFLGKLRDMGVSATVTQCWLSGVPFLPPSQRAPGRYERLHH